MVLNYYKEAYTDPQTSRKFSFCFLTPSLWAILADFSKIIVVCRTAVVVMKWNSSPDPKWRPAGRAQHGLNCYPDA